MGLAPQQIPRRPLPLPPPPGAVRWAKQNVSRYGGDARDLVLIGHSAGAHLAALCLANGRWLEEEGVMPQSSAGPTSSPSSSSLSPATSAAAAARRLANGSGAPSNGNRAGSAAPPDHSPVVSAFVGISGVYDVPRMASNVVGRMLAEGAFGDDRKAWRRASPVHCVRSLGARTSCEGLASGERKTRDGERFSIDEAAAGAGALASAAPGAPRQMVLDGTETSGSPRHAPASTVHGDGGGEGEAVGAAAVGKALRSCPLLGTESLLLTTSSDFHLDDDADALADAIREARREFLGVGPPGGAGAGGVPGGVRRCADGESADTEAVRGGVRHVRIEGEDHLSTMLSFGEPGKEASDTVFDFLRGLPRPGRR